MASGGAQPAPEEQRPAEAGLLASPNGYLLRHSFMKALRSSPFLPVASWLQVFILSCWVAGFADRQVFMNALRSSPFLSPASLLQVAILLCCLVIGALAAAFFMSGASLCAFANA